MKVFDGLIQEIKNKKTIKKERIDSLEAFIKSISQKLLDDNFHPSKDLKNLFDKYLRRAKYPMEVAIVGQFSSGKSTFLNALLSKDVLPTGITPVTSKVNFINYGDEYKLKITFKSGATEFHDIEHLAKYTDQRKAIEDIKYLSIYAPVEMLKEVSFVDTPGLNSQSKFDTQTTNNILRDVDGIIWLGLIDSVAKKSELDVLEQYLPNYANKSVCLLNQKDRLNKEEIQTALEYGKLNYKDYFSEIIAISAKQALDARVHQKQNLFFNEKNRFLKDINDDILSNDVKIDEEFFSNKLSYYNDNVKKIKNKDFKHYLDEQADSNILEVLKFIDNVIRPKAQESKIFAMKKDFASLCEILQNEYTRITSVYLDLSEIIDDFSYNLEIGLKKVESELSRQMEILNIKINENISLNVSQIYSNIKPVKKYILKEKKSLLGIKYIKEEYQSYMIQSSIPLCISNKDCIELLDSIVNEAMTEVEKILKSFEKELLLWQLKNEKLTKNRAVASDVEFNNIRYFAAGIYESIFKDFIVGLDKTDTYIKMKISKLALKNRFDLAYEKTVKQIIIQIVNMQNSYEKNPQASVINSIDESEILLIFKENLDFNYIKRELEKDDSFLKTSFDNYKKEVSDISSISINKIHTDFNTVNKKVKLLDDIKSSIYLIF